jgi:hypothetical protein
MPVKKGHELKGHQGFKILHARIPAALHTLARKIALDHGTTLTAMIVDYILFLKKKHPSYRRPLDERDPKDAYKLGD